MSTLPSGTITFLFSDIEGSTRLLEELGDRYAELHRDHRKILREELQKAGGQEVDTQGDAFFFSFSRAKDAVRGAVAGQRALNRHDWPAGAEVRVRMGLHTGEPTVGEEGYLGMDVVRAARICSAGHGRQILMSETTRALIGNDLPEGIEVRDLGRAQLKDVQHEHIFQLALAEEQTAFPPLKTTTAASAGDALAAQIQQRVSEQILAGFDENPHTRANKGFSAMTILALLVAGIVLLILIKVLFL